MSKLEATAITCAALETFVRQITVLEWNQARAGYVTDGAAWDPRGWALSGFVDMNAMTLTSLPQVLSEYKERVKQQPQSFGNLLHTIADVVPKIYLAKGFRSIVSCRLPLLQNIALQPGRMYTLYYAEENGLLRDILRDDTLCEKPYADIPLMGAEGSRTVGGPDQIFRGKSGTRDRQHWVRLFHPFWLVEAQRRNYLNVGHLTDLHSSTLWDFMEKRIFPVV